MASKQIKDSTLEQQLELCQFILSDKSVTMEYLKQMIKLPSFPYRIDNWYRVLTKADKEEAFGEYHLNVDYPSLEYYHDTIEDEPDRCKEFLGVKYVFAINDDTSGCRLFY